MEATIVIAACQELTTQAETVNAAAKAHLIHALEAVRFDETGLHVEAALYWIHMASTGLVTYLQAHAKRGSKALDGVGILTKRQGQAQPSTMTQMSLSASRRELCAILPVKSCLSRIDYPFAYLTDTSIP